MSALADRRLLFLELAVEPDYVVLLNETGIEESFSVNEAIIFPVNDPLDSIRTFRMLMTTPNFYATQVGRVELGPVLAPPDDDKSCRYAAHGNTS